MEGLKISRSWSWTSYSSFIFLLISFRQAFVSFASFRSVGPQALSWAVSNILISEPSNGSNAIFFRPWEMYLGHMLSLCQPKGSSPSLAIYWAFDKFMVLFPLLGPRIPSKFIRYKLHRLPIIWKNMHLFFLMLLSYVFYFLRFVE